jgi:EpsI family protein
MLDKIYNQTLSRTYIGPQGERIMLSVAYGGDQSDGTRAHRPEVCYPAQGFQILSGSESAIQLNTKSLRVRQLVSKLGARVEPITYWVTVGESVALSGTEQKFAQLKYTLRGVIPDGMLVRISNIEPNAESAYVLHQTFVRELASSLPAAQAAQIVGGPAD